jgi:hypothetical protein
MNIEILSFLQKKMPYEIILMYIIPFSYQLQNKKLLKDIENYYDTTEFIDNFNKYTPLLNIKINMRYEITTIIFWSYFHALKDAYKSLFLMKEKYWNADENIIDHRVRNINNTFSPDMKFKFYWGLLSVTYRNFLINTLTNIYYNDNN